MSDFDDLMLDPIYDTLGTMIALHPVDATEDSEVVFTGLAIDKTAGVQIEEKVGIYTIVPLMALKAKDLAAQELEPKDLLNLMVTLNGVVWLIQNHIPKPGIYGEPGGQVYYQMRKRRNGSS